MRIIPALITKRHIPGGALIIFSFDATPVQDKMQVLAPIKKQGLTKSIPVS
jgi:hypothetical protein